MRRGLGWAFFALLIGLLALGSCSKSSETSAARSYAGAGSEWNATLYGDGTFTITHKTSAGGSVDLTVNGTYVSYSTGFLKLTVSSSSGSGGPTAGAQAYALEIPDTVFFLKPIGGDSNLIAMVPSGTCPSSDLSENWIKMKTESSWNAASEVSGTFTYTTSSSTGNVTHKYSLSAPTVDLGASVVGTGTCSSGLLQIPGGNGADIFLTPAGGAIVHTDTSHEGTSDGIIMALPPTSSAIVPTSLAGSYAGLVFSSGSGGRNFPVKTTLAVSGGGVQGSGYEVTDVTTGTVTSGGALLILNTAGVSNGFVTGTIDTSGPSGGGTAKPLTCMALPDAGGTGKTVLGCATVDQSDNFFSIILTSI